MLFQKRLDRARKFLKEQKDARDSIHGDEKIPLEKGDPLALFLSALLVFSPIFIVLIIILVLAYSLITQF